MAYSMIDVGSNSVWFVLSSEYTSKMFEVDVVLRPALLGVVGVHLRLVPRDHALGGRVLVLVDHAERVTELVAHHPLVLAQSPSRLEPSVVHRSPWCAGTVRASVPTVDHENPFSAKLTRMLSCAGR